MAKVYFFSTQVKYQGTFDSYSKEDLYVKAVEKQYHGVDCFDYSKELPKEQALELDHVISVENTYPGNKIATVYWSYIWDDI